jgi:hypothetical protein
LSAVTGTSATAALAIPGSADLGSVVIVAALPSHTYAGDTSFSAVSRLTATGSGAAARLKAWSHVHAPSRLAIRGRAAVRGRSLLTSKISGGVLGITGFASTGVGR